MHAVVARGSAGERWVRRFHPTPEATARIVFFPHAGGSASFYFPWSKALSAVADVLTIQYPGRQERMEDPCIDDLTGIADHSFEALRRWVDRPLFLFGHSMGAIVAFEVALRLERANEKPARLFASGRGAPSFRRNEGIHLRDDDGFLAAIELVGEKHPLLHGNEELRRVFLPAIRNDYKAVETYECEPGATVGCPVTVLVGDADPLVTMDEARAWRDHTLGGCELRIFRGDHFYLIPRRTAAIQTIAERLGGDSPPRRPLS
jgi:surfactin synthase thioesterase subunit